MSRRGWLVVLLMLVFVGMTRAQEAQIVSFETDNTSYAPGGAVTAHWSVTGANEAIIEVYDLLDADNPIQTLDRLPTEGSLSIFLPESATSGVRLVLWAANHTIPPGSITMVERFDSWAIDLMPLAPCEPRFYRSVEEINECPSMVQTPVNAAYQPFENGFMLWRADTGDVWVMYKSGRLVQYPAWQYGVFPDNPVDDAPPDGYSAPINGFGKVWGNVQRVRSALGWALGPEVGYEMTVQYGATPLYVPYFYMTLPDDDVIRIETGRWTSEAAD